MTIQPSLSLHLGPYPASGEGQNLNPDSRPGKSRRKLPPTPSTKAHRHHGIVTCALIVCVWWYSQSGKNYLSVHYVRRFTCPIPAFLMSFPQHDPYYKLWSAGQQPQTLGHSEYPPRTQRAQSKPGLEPSRLPTSTQRVSDVPLAVSTPAASLPRNSSLPPNSSLPYDEVRATSRQRMKHQNAPNSAAVLPLTRVPNSSPQVSDVH